MIDELAKAICCPSGCKSQPKCNMETCGGLYRECALAVLRRLREPTPEMVDAGTASLSGYPAQFPDEDYTDDARKMYRAMIDAAIGEKDAK